MIYKYVKVRWRENGLYMLILALAALLQTAIAVIAGEQLNQLIKLNFRLFIMWSLVQLGVWALYFGALYVQISYGEVVKQKMSADIRRDLAFKIEKLSFQNFHTRQVGDYSAWLNNDIEMIEQNGFNNLYQLISGVFSIVFSFIGLLTYHYSLVITTILLMLLMLLIPKIIQKKMSKAAIQLSLQNEAFLATVTDVLNGFDTLFALNLTAIITQRMKVSVGELAHEKVAYAKKTGQVAVLGAVGNVLSQFIIVLQVGWLVMAKQVTIGSIQSIRLLVVAIFNTLGNLSGYITALNATTGIFAKYDQYEIHDIENTEIKLAKAIELSNVSYQYGDVQVLRDVNFTFEIGKKYAIIGNSGSGKSTLLNILAGKLLGYQGAISLDGHALNTLSSMNVRENVLYVDQSAYLFQGSIRDNLTLGQVYSTTEVQAALEFANITGFIASLPARLDTQLQSNGQQISGGQRQRLALARALLRKPRVILLDESTANLDQRTAKEIENALLKKRGLTVIMVTHTLTAETETQLDGILHLS